MTIQNPKILKQKFKEDFRNRLKQFVLNLMRFIESMVCKTNNGVVCDQLMRSGTSVGANYFEARAANSKNDFIRFFTYSLRSANESKFWLELLIETQKCDIQSAKVLLDEATQIANILASSIMTMKGKK